MKSIKVKGMNCGHCVKAVDAALRRLSGISDLKVSIGQAVVTTDVPPDTTQIRQAIEDAGFEVV